MLTRSVKGHTAGDPRALSDPRALAATTKLVELLLKKEEYEEAAPLQVT